MFSGGKATYTVEDAIDKLGYGPFQMKLMFVVGLAWVSLKVLMNYSASLQKNTSHHNPIIINCYQQKKRINSLHMLFCIHIRYHVLAWE